MFKIKIADLVIGIYNKYEFIKRQCSDYIADENAKIDFTVSASEEDLKKEREISNGDFSNGYLESVCVYRNIANRLPKYNAFLLHAAVVCVDGEAYAFTAKSGTGKSTHIRLWRKLLNEKVSVINGDKPILRIVNDRVYAYGTPWCGKEGYNSNQSAPLKALCFLERAENNVIIGISSNQAAKKIVNQIIIPKNSEDVAKTLDLLDFTLKKIDLWFLKCNMDISAAELSFDAMKGGQLK